MFEYGPYLRKNRGCFRAEDFKAKTPEEKAKTDANREFYTAQAAANEAADAVVFSHRGTDYRVWQVREGVYVSGLTEAQKANLHGKCEENHRDYVEYHTRCPHQSSLP